MKAGMGMPYTSTHRVIVIMPTYNERENLQPTIGGIMNNCTNVEVLVVDDSSPDGTGELAEQMAAKNPRLHVIHRKTKNGLGPAYLAGFQWALLHQYDVVCEMDMDGSHRPQDLPQLIRTIDQRPDVDLVIGSRRVRGGSTENWPVYRDLISRCGSWYSRLCLGVPVHDMTAGFRAYRASIMQRLHLDTVRANGYVFQVDMTRRVHQAGGTIVEVPIVFVERTRGKSKMSKAIVIEAMCAVTHWGLQRLFHTGDYKRARKKSAAQRK